MRRQEREVEVAGFCRAFQAGFRGLGALEKLVRFKPGTSASVCLKKVTLVVVWRGAGAKSERTELKNRPRPWARKGGSRGLESGLVSPGPCFAKLRASWESQQGSWTDQMNPGRGQGMEGDLGVTGMQEASRPCSLRQHIH